MAVTREQFIESLRKYIGVKYAHQGRSRIVGMDCGGLALESCRDVGITSLEFLGYSDFPRAGKFDELIQQEAVSLGWEREFPFNFDGTELLPGDLISFDYGKGEGTRHIAIVSGWDGRRFRIIDAHQRAGVSEHALAPPFVMRGTKIKGWSFHIFQ